MTLLDSELISVSSVPAAPRRRRWWSATLPAIAALVLTVIVGSVLLAHVIAPGGYNAQNITASYLAPTWFSGAHPLGTDDLGRDMLARLVYGGRPALGISSVAALLATALGLALALVSVMGGRFWDGLFGRLADVQLAIPAVLLALIVLAFAGSGLVPIIVVLTVGGWVLTFRIVRVHASRIIALPYIEAARLSGARSWALLRRHVIPATLPLLVVALTLNFSSILILESSLAYLGLGVQPPQPDWGQMVAEGQAQLNGAYWLSIFPGILIVLTVVSVQILGDRIADHFSLTEMGR
jgi:peptide/nickel transport system permease protein